ncbi:MAG: GNAT family N-acetyltransferase [Myxococcota bacterium]
MFGPNAGELLQKLYPLEGNYMSHQLALFLWVDDEIVGMFSGYSYDVKKRIAGSNMWQALKKGPLLLPRMAWKAMTLSKVLSFSEHLEEGEFCVSFVAIEPTMRGKGLSKRLLARGTEFAREQGASTLTLCVEVDNEAAVSAYRSLGMEIVSTSEPQKKPRGEGEWTMHRMSMPIAQDG